MTRTQGAVESRTQKQEVKQCARRNAARKAAALHLNLWEAKMPDLGRKFLGISVRRWIEYTAAILVGNAIYYFSLVPHLPPAFRHQKFLLDGGSAIDFVVCLAVYGLIRLGSKV
jgi:hypothetical protein